MTILNEDNILDYSSIVVEGQIDEITGENLCTVVVADPFVEYQGDLRTFYNVRVHYHCYEEIDATTEQADIDGYTAFQKDDWVTVLCKIMGSYPERYLEPVAITGFRDELKECFTSSFLTGKAIYHKKRIKTDDDGLFLQDSSNGSLFCLDDNTTKIEYPGAQITSYSDVYTSTKQVGNILVLNRLDFGFVPPSYLHNLPRKQVIEVYLVDEEASPIGNNRYRLFCRLSQEFARTSIWSYYPKYTYEFDGTNVAIWEGNYATMAGWHIYIFPSIKQDTNGEVYVSLGFGAGTIAGYTGRYFNIQGLIHIDSSLVKQSLDEHIRYTGKLMAVSQTWIYGDRDVEMPFPAILNEDKPTGGRAYNSDGIPWTNFDVNKNGFSFVRGTAQYCPEVISFYGNCSGGGMLYFADHKKYSVTMDGLYTEQDLGLVSSCNRSWDRCSGNYTINEFTLDAYRILGIVDEDLMYAHESATIIYDECPGHTSLCDYEMSALISYVNVPILERTINENNWESPNWKSKGIFNAIKLKDGKYLWLIEDNMNYYEGPHQYDDVDKGYTLHFVPPSGSEFPIYLTYFKWSDEDNFYNCGIGGHAADISFVDTPKAFYFKLNTMNCYSVDSKSCQRYTRLFEYNKDEDSFREITTLMCVDCCQMSDCDCDIWRGWCKRKIT